MVAHAVYDMSLVPVAIKADNIKFLYIWSWNSLFIIDTGMYKAKVESQTLILDILNMETIVYQ